MIKFAALLLLATLVKGQGQSSCVGRCNDYVDHSYTCQCNSYCSGYGDCCDDYISVCVPDATCEGRCGSKLDSSKPCQCNTQCANYGDCCDDYNKLCVEGGDGGGTGCSALSVSNAEILEISLELWNLDVNRAAAGDVVFNRQASTSDSSTVDGSPEPFFTYVNPNLLLKPTYQSLIALLDNYQSVQGINEVTTSEETAEQDAFLDLFLDTSIGKRLFEFLQSKNRAGCSDLATFRDYLRKQWFELFSRQNNAMDTSGFEHVFVGEIKGSSVSGFHNWVQFYLREQDKSLNYYGYVRYTNPELYGVHFEWEGYMKGLSGTAIGASPEADLALFTLCHMLRPASACSVNITDDSGTVVTRSIQTWTWTKTYPGDGLSYVASAYYVI